MEEINMAAIDIEDCLFKMKRNEYAIINDGMVVGFAEDVGNE